MKKALFVFSVFAPAVFAGGHSSEPGPESDYLELCTSDACAIPVETKEFDGTIYLVKSESDYEALAREWVGARFFLASESDYEELRAGREVFTLPSLRAKAGTTAGPLVSGSINVNVSTGRGGAGCADCHTGTWKEIHAKALAPKKPDNGK